MNEPLKKILKERGVLSKKFRWASPIISILLVEEGITTGRVA
jgi:hypothetical protein